MAETVKMTRVTPTIFIGLGGAGCKTLTRFESLLRRRDELVQRFTRCLKYDTRDRDEGVEDNASYINLSPGSTDGQDIYATLKMQPQFDVWWARNMDGNPYVPQGDFSRGAGQIRACGRLLIEYAKSDVVSTLTKIVDKFQRDLDELKKTGKLDKEELPEDARPVVWLIAGGGGGTGSSALLDFGLLIKNIKLIDPMIKQTPAAVFAVVLKPDIIYTTREAARSDRPSMDLNFARLMAETDFIHQPRVFENGDRYPLSCVLSDKWNPKGWQPPFDLIFALGAENDAGNRLGAKDKDIEYYDMISKVFDFMCGGRRSEEFLGKLVNDRKQLIDVLEALPERRSTCNRLGRLGMLRITVPVAKIKRLLAVEHAIRGIDEVYLDSGSDLAGERFLQFKTDSRIEQLSGENLLCRVDQKTGKRSAFSKPVFISYDDVLKPVDKEGFDNVVRTWKGKLLNDLTNLDRSSAEARAVQVQKSCEDHIKALIKGQRTFSAVWRFLDLVWDDLQAKREGMERDCVAATAKRAGLDKDFEDRVGQWRESYGGLLWWAGQTSKRDAEQWLNEYANRVFAELQVSLRLECVRTLARNIRALREAAKTVRDKIAKEAKNHLQASLSGIFPKGGRQVEGVTAYLINSNEEMRELFPEFYEPASFLKRGREAAARTVQAEYASGWLFTEEATGAQFTPEGLGSYYWKLVEEEGKAEDDRDVVRQNAIAGKALAELEAGACAAAEAVFLGDEQTKRVQDLEVWDIVLRDAKKRGKVKPEELVDFLSRRIDAFQSSAMPFGPLSPRTRSIPSGQSAKVINYLVINTDVFLSALERHGVKNPKEVLSRLQDPLAKTGYDPVNIKDSGTDIILMTMEYGWPSWVLPEAIYLDALYKNPTMDGHTIRWTDRRFPAWIGAVDTAKQAKTDILAGLAVAWGVIPTKGSWFVVGTRQFSGAGKFLDALRDDKKVRSDVEAKVRDFWNSIPRKQQATKLADAKDKLTAMAGAKSKKSESQQFYASVADLLDEYTPDTLDLA